jgi:two-component system NtrC family sensor kinase
LLYYRIEPILDSKNQLWGAFVLARQGYGTFATIERRRNRIATTTSALVILLSLLTLILVRRSVTRPINELIRRIKEIGQGQREQRIEVKGRDEVASVAQEFNLMCQKLQESHARLVGEQQEKLRLEQELRHSERLASVGRLAAGLAHEIGTPLNIIGGRSEYLLRRARSPEELKDNLGVIRSQSDRIAAIVRQLLEFSRRREPVFQPVDLALLMDNVKYLLAHQLRDKTILVETEGLSHLPKIDADQDLLQQVFINLFSNSLHALTPGGVIKIGADLMDRDLAMTSPEARNWLRISFEDNGAGISTEHIGRVFDPFFTTKDIGEGTGLGLSVSYGIIQEHGGEIHAESEPGRFTRFIIDLPIEQPRRPARHYSENSNDSRQQAANNQPGQNSHR